MSKGLETLDYFVALCTLNFDKEGAEKVATIKQALIKAQKQEKLLKVMKDKWVNVAVLIHSKTVEEYNNNAHTPYNLTEEEYELLKEVLKNE